MRSNRKNLLFVGLLALALATPVAAGIPFSKKSVQKKKEGGAYDLFRHSWATAYHAVHVSEDR